MTSQEAASAGAAERKLVIVAVLLMLLAGFSSSVVHIAVRFVVGELPAIQIVFLRTLFTLLATAPFIFRPGTAAWRTNNLPLQVLRGAFGVLSIWLWYLALSSMPLADAGVLSFTAPIFVTIGAALFFGELVGVRRVSAVVVGLIGAVIVLKPGTGAISIAALAAIASSIMWAAVLLLTKRLARFDSAITVTFYLPLMISPIAGLASIPVWITPSLTAVLILAGAGIMAAIGNFCFAQAVRMTDASTLMPMDYMRLLWIAGGGYVLFSEVPGWSTWLGAALITGSTAYVAWRETRIARNGRAER